MAETNNHNNKEASAKLILTIVIIIALVVLSLARLLQPDFKVDLIVYAILGGILFGVGGIRELLGSIQFTPPSKQEEHEEKRPTNRKKRR